MKKIILTGLAVFAFTFANAQEKGKFRVGLDLGYAIPSGGGGVLFAIEPKYNIADNMNVGLRIAGAAMAKEFSGSGESLEAKIGTSASYVGTYDYYFTGSSFVPYVGAGAGIYSLSNAEFDVDGMTGSVDLDSKSKFGGLVRAGFELGKFRMGVEYNIVPKSKINNSDVTAKNSYVGIHLGFYLGGGKWSK